MTTLDAQAGADIASRPWYVAAFGGRDWSINGPSQSYALGAAWYR
ncbi:hypothetical protein [Mycolicibacterium frederiksbergense]|nr:hypothetical protein [Mycolicibacterium frederiksbergense]